jgi:hypothetical protein
LKCRDEKIRCMRLTLMQLEETYAWNDRRRELLGKLKEELAQITRCSTGYRAVLYGSYLTKKTDPGDIDLIIAYDRRMGAKNCGSMEFPFLHKGDIQIKLSERQGYTTPLPSAESLVLEFNEFPTNASKDIRIEPDTWMELVP